MTDKLWKQTERAIAKTLKGTRVPINGRGSQPDVRCDWLAIECKERQQVPAWLKAALQQAAAGAEPAQLPIVVLHEKGKHHSSDLVVMTLSDFKEWFGNVSDSAL